MRVEELFGIEKMEKISKSNSRLFAFASITFSTVAVVGTLIFYPLLFHYMQTLDATIEIDLDFCKSRSRDMWNAMLDVQMTRGHFDSPQTKETAERLRRSNIGKSNKAALKFWADRIARDEPPQATTTPAPANGGSAPTSFLGCCTCHRGTGGPPGPPGRDGIEGINGNPGQPGDRGDPAPSDGSLANQPKSCPCTEPGPAGDAGAPGNRGPDGLAGDVGPKGDDGKPGAQGGRGPQGEKGKDGLTGTKGPSGDAGKVVNRQGTPGQPGGPGRNGNPGTPGTPGKNGKDGVPGNDGASGDPGATGVTGRNGNPGPEGNPGKQGDAGTCGQCPPPRLSPGY